MIQIEVCASSIESVVQAVKGGASRIELCASLGEGGITPPLSWIEHSIKNTDLQVFTLIRPRGGDFLYSDNEYLMMKKDIVHCGEAGCHGVVLGLLTADGKVDKERTAELTELAKNFNMSVTFHRAIDRTQDLFKSVEDIIEIGCDRILTSGGKTSAIEGKDEVKKMIDIAKERIIIMPGGGVNEDNIVELVNYLKTKEFHGSFRTMVPSRMLYRSDTFKEDYTTMPSSAERIKNIIELVNRL